MLEKIKNFFYDEKAGGIKWLPILGAVAGGVAGANLEMMEGLGYAAIPAGAAIGGALGVGLDYVKDSVMGGSQQAPAGDGVSHERSNVPGQVQSLGGVGAPPPHHGLPGGPAGHQQGGGFSAGK